MLIPEAAPPSNTQYSCPYLAKWLWDIDLIKATHSQFPQENKRTHTGQRRKSLPSSCLNTRVIFCAKAQPLGFLW